MSLFVDDQGQVKAVAPEIAKQSGWAPATKADIERAIKVKEAESATGQLKTVGEGAASGAFDAATAIPRLATAGASALTGVEDPLARVSGRQFIEDVGAVGSELLGGQGAEAAGRDIRQGQQLRAQTNPGEAFVSQLAGQVGAAAATGGASLAAGAGTGAAKALGGGLAARLAGAGVAGAIEGAPLAMVQAQDQAYIEGRQLTSQQAMAHAGIGALLGGGLSIAGKAAGEGLSAIFGAAKGALSGATERAAEGAAEKGAGSELQKVLRTGNESIDNAVASTLNEPLAGPKVADYVRDGIRGGDLRMAQRAAHEEATTALASATNEALETTRALTDKLDNRAWKLADVETRASGFAPEALEATRARAGAIRQDLADTLEGLGKDAGKVKLVQGLRDRIEAATLAIDGTESPAKAYLAMDQVRRDVASTSRSLWESAQKAANVDTKELYRVMAEKIGSHYDDTFKFLMDEGTWGTQGIAQQEANTARAALIQAERAALPNFATKVGSSYEGQGLTRDLLEADEGKIIGHLKRMGTTEGAFAERRMGQWLDAAEKFTQAAKKYGVGAEDTAAADAVQASANKFRQALSAAKEKVGSIDQAQAFLDKASGNGGVFGGSAIGSFIGGAPGAALGAGIGAVMNPAKFLAQRVQFEQMAVKTTKRLQGALGEFFGPMGSGAAALEKAGDVAAKTGTAARRAATPSLLGAFGKGASTPELAFTRRRDELQAAAQNMNEGARTAITEKFGDIAGDDPHGFGGAVMTASRAIDYLMGKMPESGPNPRSLTPLTSSIAPSKVEIAQFADAWNAVSDPLSVIDGLKTGTLRPEQIDAVKAVYPQMFQWMQQQTLEQLRELDLKGQEVPVRSRMMLDTMLDLNGAGEPAFAPTFGAKFGALMGDATPPQQGQGARAPSGAKSFSGNLKTTTSMMIGSS